MPEGPWTLPLVFLQLHSISVGSVPMTQPSSREAGRPSTAPLLASLHSQPQPENVGQVPLWPSPVIT